MSTPPPIRTCPFCFCRSAVVLGDLATRKHFVQCDLCRAQGSQCNSAVGAVLVWNAAAKAVVR